jgi:formylglycine-generating enzyme required for sulfatase activity
MRILVSLLAALSLLSFSVKAQEGKPEGSQTKPGRWTNTLGMIFVQVPDTRVWFCIWQTRIQDYGVFVKEGHWGRLWPDRPDFEQGPTHPVVNVSWEDSKDFCIWLTQKERALGILASNQVYRLPTDLEWSQAAGLPKESGKTAEKRSGEFGSHLPWGRIAQVRDADKHSQISPLKYSVPSGAGNFAGASDGFKFTAPVGSFKPNTLSIFDLGGNIYEWCIDSADDGRRHILRGCSWANDPRPLSVRDFTLPDNLIGNFGFRCVFTDTPSSP